MVYGQTELTRDLIQARLDNGGQIRFSASDVTLNDVTSESPVVRWTDNGKACSLRCDYIVGCDGFHGVSRHSIPADSRRSFERIYPFGWLGLLSNTPPVADELIYASHRDGFALCSMRSESRSRYYIQCDVNEDLANWSDERFWEVLSERIGPRTAASLVSGPSIEKSIAPLRSYVVEPMRYGNLFLAGDAAHIVPPTGAKGLNLAISDVRLLARGFSEWYLNAADSLLEQYSATCLQRVWKTERFSWYMSTLLHQFSDHGPFDKRMQRAEFDYIASSETASRSIAENYVGLPMPWETG